MARYRLSWPAERQIDEILHWSQERFGELTRERYAALLVKAMEDVADDPQQSAVVWRRVKSGRIGVYHTGHSRERSPGSVGDPRHYLVFRIGHDGVVDILGFVHERMLFKRALRRILTETAENSDRDG